MNNIFALRARLKMTQFEFADYCKISRNSIARYETGGKISRSCAEKIAAACGVSVSFVLGDENAPEAKKEAPSQGLDDRLVEMLVSLSPDQVQRVMDFVAGMKASDKA